MRNVEDVGGPEGSTRHHSERWVVFSLLLVFWIAFQTVFFLYGILRNEAAAIRPAALLRDIVMYIFHPAELAIVGVGILICLAIYATLRGLRHLSLWTQLLVTVFGAALGAACFSVAVSIMSILFGLNWPAPTLRWFAIDTVRWFAPFGLWSGVSLAVTYNTQIRERERRLALLQAQTQQAHMRALRYQVNPHLLYNTLNSIAALILDKQNDVAEAMVVRLSDFFRASLSIDPHADVELADEVAFQRLYLDIEQMRFPDRLSSEIDIPEDLERAQVPSMILQPIVENALKHGVHPDGSPTHLKISATRGPRGLVLEVADNGPGPSAIAGTGVGLANVRDRLIARFGERADVHAENRPGVGFIVRLTFPVVMA